MAFGLLRATNLSVLNISTVELAEEVVASRLKRGAGMTAVTFLPFWVAAIPARLIWPGYPLFLLVMIPPDLAQISVRHGHRPRSTSKRKGQRKDRRRALQGV